MNFRTGYIVIKKSTGEPIDRDGHFKVYATRAAANRRRYTCNHYSNATEVREIRLTII